jgi:hypothetical protein
MYSTRYSCQIVWNLNFLDRFSENTKISNFTNIFQVGAELLHAGGRTDGQTYMTKVIVAFLIFSNAHKKGELRTEMEDVT